MAEKSTAAQAASKRMGRPPLAPEAAKSVVVMIRMTPAQKAKLTKIGGQAFLRAKIDAEPV